jgi:hypothetical protein
VPPNHLDFVFFGAWSSPALYVRTSAAHRGPDINFSHSAAMCSAQKAGICVPGAAVAGGEADLSGPSYMSTALLYTDGSTLVQVSRQWGGTRKDYVLQSLRNITRVLPLCADVTRRLLFPLPPLHPAFVCTPAKWSGKRSFTSQGLKC